MLYTKIVVINQYITKQVIYRKKVLLALRKKVNERFQKKPKAQYKIIFTTNQADFLL